MRSSESTAWCSTPHLADMTIAALAERDHDVAARRSLHRRCCIWRSRDRRSRHVALVPFRPGIRPGTRRFAASDCSTRRPSSCTCRSCKLPDASRQTTRGSAQDRPVLAGKKVLIVDDDIRNIFALTSILEWHNMIIVSAETGRDAIRICSRPRRTVDIVLMDIMMPEMDGLDTMRVIRKLAAFQRTCRSSPSRPRP